MSLKIYTVHDWGARKPKQGITMCNKSTEIIFHHTAGHHREISLPTNESVEEAIRYRRDIQNFHMDVNGWNDSGDNFLVCRNGMVLQGRWFTVSAIQGDHMVVSAHCPNHNTSIGIEHEHLGSEPMTVQQRNASAQLMAWIADKYSLRSVLPIYPHNKFYATACPANLEQEIPRIKQMAQTILDS